MADALEAQRAAYAAGQIVPTLQMAGSKRLEPVAIGKAAQELAAKKAREVALTSGGVQGQHVTTHDSSGASGGANRASAGPVPIGVQEKEVIPEEEEGEAPPPAAKAKGSPPAWLTVSFPQAAYDPEMKITSEDVDDAMTMTLLELTDAGREGGPENVPEKPMAKDDSLQKGPHYYKFADKETVRTIVSEYPTMVVENKDGTDFICRLSLLKSTKNQGAYSLASATGFWGEVYNHKEQVIKSPEAAEKIIADSLGVMVTKCKYPKTGTGGIPNMSKFVFNANLVPGDDKDKKILPAVLLVQQGGGRAKPVTYRVQQNYFPGLCNRCHQKRDPDLPCDVCKRDKEILAHAKVMRDAAAAANEKRQQKEPSKETTAEKLTRQREHKMKMKKCREQQVCIFFATGYCRDGGDKCIHGKHAMLA